MKRTKKASAGLAAAAVALTLGLSACSSEDTAAADDTAGSESTSQEPTTEESPAESPAPEESTEMADDAGAQTFGAGCSAIPADGAGSFNGMAGEPVATAASANPALETLVTAVTAADLGDTLNSAEGITVFAPDNDAFGKIPPADLEGVLADKDLLTTVLTHHVIAGQLSPEQLAGKHETLAGDTLRVRGSGEMFKVGKERANVLCGNIPTANATVYIVDTVLMPAS